MCDADRPQSAATRAAVAPASRARSAPSIRRWPSASPVRGPDSTGTGSAATNAARRSGPGPSPVLSTVRRILRRVDALIAPSWQTGAPSAASTHVARGALEACRRVLVVTLKSWRHLRHRHRQRPLPARRAVSATPQRGHRIPSGQRSWIRTASAASSLSVPATLLSDMGSILSFAIQKPPIHMHAEIEEFYALIDKYHTPADSEPADGYRSPTPHGESAGSGQNGPPDPSTAGTAPRHITAIDSETQSQTSGSRNPPTFSISSELLFSR